MADIRCPMCGKLNPDELETCQYCGARIKPLGESPRSDSQPLKPGEEPVKKETSEFEKVKFGDGTIRPGEAPTKKDTAELERALPTWLRSLREEKRPADGDALAEPSSDDDAHAASQAATGSDFSSGSSDWLSGLSKAASDNEEVPDWLDDLRNDTVSEPETSSSSEEEQAPALNNEDWMKRLGGEQSEVTPEPAETSEPPDTAKLPTVELPSGGALPEETPGSSMPDWLQELKPAENKDQEPPAASDSEENAPDWLSGMPAIPAESPQDLRESEESAPAEDMPDWLAQLNQKAIKTEPDNLPESGEPLPDWLSSYESAPEAVASTPDESVPEWLSSLDVKSGPESEAPTELPGGEQQAFSESPEELPDWLSQIDAEDKAAGQFEEHENEAESASETPAPLSDAEALPDWLAGIEQTAPSSGGTPALVMDDQDALSKGEAGEAAYAMEAPDWLAKLKPDQNIEKEAEGKDLQEEAENLEAAELPSWVQAMRPVESVVDSKTAQIEERQEAEVSGPLAGLRGVLPAKPGLGMLRKPPAYSSKLQISDGQNRYADQLEKLVAGESQPHKVRPAQAPLSRLWRWLVAALLFLSVGLPFASGVQFAPPTLLLSSDKGASSRIIDGLSDNTPVLVAFDYDPALSGELEAVAAPLMDQVLARGIPLAVVSTSPTGPALAEHFLKNTPLVNMYRYQSGIQYVNLGYLAGGPAGILYLADAITEAMPVGVDGKSAWKTGPLQNIRDIRNFAAVIILTDNADVGRSWIEQAVPRLGNTPMLMIISAQAEPMIRPYFDSGQLKGLVSGLSDAKIYEQPHNRPGLAYHYWNSFSVGMLVAELIIAAGVLFSFVAARRAPRKQSRGES